MGKLCEKMRQARQGYSRPAGSHPRDLPGADEKRRWVSTASPLSCWDSTRSITTRSTWPSRKKLPGAFPTRGSAPFGFSTPRRCTGSGTSAYPLPKTGPKAANRSEQRRSWHQRRRAAHHRPDTIRSAIMRHSGESLVQRCAVPLLRQERILSELRVLRGSILRNPHKLGQEPP